MNLIYQFYIGQIPYYARAGSVMMKSYADGIGADYLVDFNRKTVSSGDSRYYNCLRPVFDESLDEYDRILFCDMDVFPVEGISEDIFDQPLDLFGIAEERHQPGLRHESRTPICEKNDEKWAALACRRFGSGFPRDRKNRLRVFNSGVVVYTREGIGFARDKWVGPDAYRSVMASLPRFYHFDQNYLGAMLGLNRFTVMDGRWNSQIHYVGDRNRKPREIFDSRTPDTNFVHVQLRGRNRLDDDRIHDIVNKPISEWRHERA